MEAEDEKNDGDAPKLPDTDGEGIVQRIYKEDDTTDEMWRALRQAEAVWCPATSLLSSRASPSLSSPEKKGTSNREKLLLPRTASPTVLKLTDLTGVSLPLSLPTSSSKTTKRSYSRSVYTITLSNMPERRKNPKPG